MDHDMTTIEGQTDTETGNNTSAALEALQRAAKKHNDFNHDKDNELINEVPEDDKPTPPLVDLGIFGNFWITKSKGNEDKLNMKQEEIEDLLKERPRPVFNKEDYYDRYPELKQL